eukprot:2270664-Lingulodinium_polyedra.AAC.1
MCVVGGVQVTQDCRGGITVASVRLDAPHFDTGGPEELHPPSPKRVPTPSLRAGRRREWESEKPRPRAN